MHYYRWSHKLPMESPARIKQVLCVSCQIRPHNAKGLCTTCYQRQRRANDPIYRQRHRDRNRESRRKVLYGVDSVTYERMLQEQNELCKICKHAESGKQLAVDHDWETGEIRGLLCFRCNTKLGWYDRYSVEIGAYLNDKRWFRTLRATPNTSTKYRTL